MPLIVSERVIVPDADLTFSAIRSPGPGGQNVNKVATAVQLRFDLGNTQALDAGAKQRLRARAGHRLNDDGTLLFVARAHRSQERNRADALERLRQLILDSLEPPRPRKATRPTRASKERRLVGKALQQRRKVLRGRVRGED
ncbi:MAG TPA: alternative ribosome rescue aminoacyl-tRNA hydrolase ArfB [Steroidobacteraceae bacterium]|jgi:ribosome-associated protein|nr:alternative ribosome rescue aminoacyl-tRNA hydrolase ArfB [Steroidobacteraceae bacterium]